MRTKKMKCGMKVKIIGNTTNHGIPEGTIVVLGQKNGVNHLVPEYGCYVGPQDIAPVATTKAEIEEEVERLKTEITVEEAKLAYMKKTKSKIFDETEFKVWAALQQLNTKKTDIEKARIIAKIISGE